MTGCCAVAYRPHRLPRQRPFVGHRATDVRRAFPVGLCMTRVIRTLSTLLAVLMVVAVYSAVPSGTAPAPTEAPTGFDNLTNGFFTQAVFDADRAVFEERDTIEGGLGPVYNAQSCAECHQSPVTGAISQVMELRSATYRNGVYTDHPGGSLINDRAIDAAIGEHVFDGENVQTFRTSLNTLGDGFVESIADATLRALSAGQPVGMQGLVISVPIVERPGAFAIGRFGWKNQNASLLSFSGDAYLNEQGITNRLFPTENTSNGDSVALYDNVPDPEDTDNDIDAFARFMRATKAPPRDPILSGTADAMAGLGHLRLDRLQHLPRAHHRDRAARNGGRRRRVHRAGGARQQDHPSVQRLPAARRRHGRRHRPERRHGVDEQAPDAAALGLQAPHEIHARRQVSSGPRRHPAARE